MAVSAFCSSGTTVPSFTDEFSIIQISAPYHTFGPCHLRQGRKSAFKGAAKPERADVPSDNADYEYEQKRKEPELKRIPGKIYRPEA